MKGAQVQIHYIVLSLGRVDQKFNLPLLEKIKMIDDWSKEEQEALLKIINLALANKRLDQHSNYQ